MEKLPFELFKVFYSSLNHNLIKLRNVSSVNTEVITSLHMVKSFIIEKMKKLSCENDVVELRSLAEDITRIEYLLQDAWGFPRDSRFHRFYLLPYCTCPKLDNEDRLGTDFFIRSSNCIYHGVM